MFTDLHNGITAGNIVVFIDIASNQGTSCSSVANRLSISKKTASKQISVLKGESNSKIKHSPLIKEVQDDTDKRYKNLYLTEHGKLLVKQIENIVERQNKLDSINIDL